MGVQQLRFVAPAERAARAIVNLASSLQATPLSTARSTPTSLRTDASTATTVSSSDTKVPCLPSESSMGHSMDPSSDPGSVRGTKRTSASGDPGRSSEEVSAARPKVPRTAAQEAKDAALLALPLPTRRASSATAPPSVTAPPSDSSTQSQLALTSTPRAPLSLAMSAASRLQSPSGARAVRQSSSSRRPREPWSEAEHALALAYAESSKRKEPFMSRLAAAEWEAEQRVKRLLATLPTVRFLFRIIQRIALAIFRDHKVYFSSDSAFVDLLTVIFGRLTGS